MASFFLMLAAGLLLLLGAGHGVLSLIDTVRPRFFTPPAEVRQAMQGVRTRLQRRQVASPQSNLWRAWLGFNLSHSLGMLVFGAALAALAREHFSLFAHSLALQGAAVAIAASYLAISSRFWFWVPTSGFALALLSIVLAAGLA